MRRLLGTLAVAATLLASGPAEAQRKKKEEAPRLQLSKDAQPLLAQAQKAQADKDFAGSIALLAQADALPNKTADDSYMIGMLRINAGLGAQDNALVEAGIEQALATGRVAAEDQPKFIRNLGSLALNRNDYQKALAQFDRYLQLVPGDAGVMVEVAELHRRTKNNAKAVELMTQAIATQEKASGGKADESWYRRALAIAYDSNMPAETVRASEALVRAYPSGQNWRDVVLIFRETNRLDDQGNLDALRLQRAASGLTGERDFYEYAETASMRGLPGESKAVIDQGVAAGALNLGKAVVKELNAKVSGDIKADRAGLAQAGREARAAANGRAALATGDAHLGYGDYAQAAELYRLALSKGGVDPNVVNTRLGIALARSGDRAGAAAAFKAVTSQPRAQLARYWLIWTEQQGG